MRVGAFGIAAVVMLAGWTALVHWNPPGFFGWATATCATWAAVCLAATPNPRALFRVDFAGIAAGAGLALILYAGARAFLWAFCGGLSTALCGPLQSVYARFGAGSGPLVGAAIALIIAPAEEIFWRGLVPAWLRPRWGPARAVLVASAASALALLAGLEPLLAIAALFTSLAWGALAEWRRSLVPSMVSHALWDLLIVLLAPADAGGN